MRRVDEGGRVGSLTTVGHPPDRTAPSLVAGEAPHSLGRVGEWAFPIGHPRAGLVNLAVKGRGGFDKLAGSDGAGEVNWPRVDARPHQCKGKVCGEVFQVRQRCRVFGELAFRKIGGVGFVGARGTAECASDRSAQDLDPVFDPLDFPDHGFGCREPRVPADSLLEVELQTYHLASILEVVDGSDEMRSLAHHRAVIQVEHAVNLGVSLEELQENSLQSEAEK